MCMRLMILLFFLKIIPEHMDSCNNLPAVSAMQCFACLVPSFYFLQSSRSDLKVYVSMPFSLQLNLSVAAHCFYLAFKFLNCCRLQSTPDCILLYSGSLLML